MSDWQVGDLAVCVEAGWVDADDPALDGIGPQVGDVCRVDEIFAGDFPYVGFSIGFVEWPEGFFKASQFRKIRPDEHEACEPEFVTLLKRTKVRA